MGILNGARIDFEESMAGYIDKGLTIPANGLIVGQDEGTDDLRFGVGRCGNCVNRLKGGKCHGKDYTF